MSISDDAPPAAFFVQRDGIIKISFRSKGDISVNQLSRDHFGGGGHINAAGGIFEGTLEEAIAKLKKVLPEYKDELIANC